MPSVRPLAPTRPAPHPAPAGPTAWRSREVRIPVGETCLFGDLVMPQAARGLVLFAHGSGSGRHSARNRQVAAELHQAGLGTLLFDLLTPNEAQQDSHGGAHRFNIGLLTERMQTATLWVLQQAGLWELPLGYFGASTGSAAALIAAARMDGRIAAVVSRGGRPDLAGPVALAGISAPTLFIVGGADAQVLALNTEAFKHLQCPKRLAVVPGASHLFEEPGALQEVCVLASQWFSAHFQQQHPELPATQRSWGAH
jgi:putative phosphoribosyl transferase